MCQHLEGYSLRGIRKRDYPPTMYYQQPWWEDYRIFNDSISRIGMILSEGRLCYDSDKNEGLKALDDAFLELNKA